MRIIGTINAALSDMTKSEYKVALFCIGNIEEIAFDTLEALAERISTSTTSVIRFCRRLGFAGYKELQEEVKHSLHFHLFYYQVYYILFYLKSS